MVIEAIVTAIIVSIDGFFSGFAIGVKKTVISYIKLFIIGIIPVIMAIPVMILGSYISNFVKSNYANYIGFIIFIFLAISSYKQIRCNNKNDYEYNVNVITIIGSIIVGFTVGIDSSISAFSLALHGHNPFITPLYFGIFHIIFILFGNRLALCNKIINTENLEYLSPILFIVIAFSKII